MAAPRSAATSVDVGAVPNVQRVPARSRPSSHGDSTSPNAVQASYIAADT